MDVVIVNVPGTITRMPFLAPAMLKASLVQAGFMCKTVDYNARTYVDYPDSVKELETYFITGNGDKSKAQDLVNKYTDELVSLNPTYIALSVFTLDCRIAALMFCERIRQVAPHIKIIVGGQGIASGGINGHLVYAEELLNNKTIDYYIKSEGEVSIVELVKGNTSYPGINSNTFVQIDDLDSLPMPDYSDYDFSLYDVPALLVLGSRGCVRHCSFCDIHDHWKYRYRSGKSVANEIIELSKRHGITDFIFGDSLVNGSIKEFVVFLDSMAEYNKQVETPIKWRGQYIVRSKKQLTEAYWQKLQASGAYQLGIGVETGSDAVREHMNKKFTNADLDYTMEMLLKYGITCTFLLIIGYPTETQVDFEQTLNMLERYKKYANTIITEVEFGSTLGIFLGTPLHKRAKEFNIALDKHENNWISFDNEELTLRERVRRRNYARQYAIDLGYVLPADKHVNVLQSFAENYNVFEQRNKVNKIIWLNQGR